MLGLITSHCLHISDIQNNIYVVHIACNTLTEYSVFFLVQKQAQISGTEDVAWGIGELQSNGIISIVNIERKLM